MKHTAFFSLALMLFLSVIGLFPASAQPVVNITAQLTMSPNPSPYLSDWQSSPQTIVLNANLAQPYNQPVKVMAQLTLNGQVVAQTNFQKMKLLSLHQGMNSFNAAQLIPYNAVDFVGGIDQSAQRAGKLPEGNYQLCIWFADGESGRDIGGSACNPFAIRDAQPPTLLSPANGTVLNATVARTKQFTTQQFSLSQLAGMSGSQLGNLRSFDLVSGGNHFLYAIDPKITERDTAEAMQIPITNIRRGGRNNNTTDYIRYELKDLLIGSQTVSGQGAGDPVPTESISLNFSWLPPMPTPAQPIKYRLKIVEVLPGQSAVQAFQTGTPLADKNNLTTTSANIIDILTTDIIDLFFPRIAVPNNPRQFVWSVQSQDLQGNPIGKNNGWAEPWMFDVGDKKPPVDSPKIKLDESFFDVFVTVDMPINLGWWNQPCPYVSRTKLKEHYVTGCIDGKRRSYEVWTIFRCTLRKGHGGAHDGTVETYYILRAEADCNDNERGNPDPPKNQIKTDKDMAGIPVVEGLDHTEIVGGGNAGNANESCPYVSRTKLKDHYVTGCINGKRRSYEVWTVFRCTLPKGHGGGHHGTVDTYYILRAESDCNDKEPGNPDPPKSQVTTDKEMAGIPIVESGADNTGVLGGGNPGNANEPCPYVSRTKLKDHYVTGCIDGKRRSYEVWTVFRCTLPKGHGGGHHGTVDTYYILRAEIDCNDKEPGNPIPPKNQVVTDRDLAKIPVVDGGGAGNTETVGGAKGNNTNEPCPYVSRTKLKDNYVTKCINGKRRSYEVWIIFRCTLHKGHGGDHHGTVETVYVLRAEGECNDSEPGNEDPPKSQVRTDKELARIPVAGGGGVIPPAGGIVKKDPCPHVEKELLRTVAGSWKRGATKIRHITYNRTTVAWADVTWTRDIWNVYLVKHCTLEKGHGGAHALDKGKEEFVKYGTLTETVTYGTGVPQVPPKSAADGLPQEDPPTK